MTRLFKISALLLLLCAGNARAQDRLTTLERELDLYAQQGKRERIGVGAISVLLGGTLLPAGIIMTKRDDELVRLVGIGALVNGAVQLVRLPEYIFPSDMERLRTRHQKRKASGLSGDALIAATEKDWKESADRERRGRMITGSVNLGIGVAAIPVGLAFMLRDQVGDMSHRKQLNVGSTMLGIGVGYATAAAYLLFRDGETVSSWKSHAVSFGLAPVASGAALMASGRF